MGRMRPRPLALPVSVLLLAACARADRIELKPSTVRFVGLGKITEVHATPYERNGKHIPDPPCAWTSSDEKVVKVAGRGNDATLTTVAPGSATVRCTIGSALAELPVTVRVVKRISVRPERADLKVADAPAPLALSVDAFDDQGAPVASRTALVVCQDEGVCRGDSRGQVWPVGPGETTARVEIEGASVTLPVKVVEGRSADARPQAFKGKENYAAEVERQYNERLKAEEKARLKAEKKAAGKK
jgi:hypothetical protein